MFESGPLNHEHGNIAAITAEIPGILMPGDHEALYELAYHHGDLILEIGAFAGKSAVIELLGARANTARPNPPTYFGVDVDATAVFRTWNTLREFGVAQDAAIFLGNINEFRKSCSISPTMVFLDGDHLYDSVRSDLTILEMIAAPGTPILCHDYVHDSPAKLEARPAIDDFVKEGRATFERMLGARCALIRLSGTARGATPTGRPADFASLRERWILDAASQLALSSKRQMAQIARMKTSGEKTTEKHRSALEKLQNRVNRLKMEAAEFRPLLGRYLYRRKKGGARSSDADSA